MKNKRLCALCLLLACACLLHDIGRKAQSADKTIRHPIADAAMAKEFLMAHGFDEIFADHVADCIRVHSIHDDCSDPLFNSLEAKILFDADKLDVVGALGIARTLQYGAQYGEPLYSRDENGNILDGSKDTGRHSFLHEYHHDQRKTIHGFHTARAAEIAAGRRKAAEAFYHAILSESLEAERLGKKHLQNLFAD